MGKISWTERNYKLNSDGNDWRRESPDTDTKKETKDVEPRKRQRKWNGHVLLFLQVFLLYFNFALFSSFCLTFYRFSAEKSRSWLQGSQTAKRKRQRKLSGHIGCYFYNYFCFISLYTLVSS